MIEPMKFDYNFIEVRPEGCFFNIRLKTFQMNPLGMKGSPRAFVFYTYNGAVPQPKPFIEGIISNIHCFMLSFLVNMIVK